MQYYDELGRKIEQPPITFIASLNFDKSSFVKKMLKNVFSDMIFHRYLLRKCVCTDQPYFEVAQKSAFQILVKWKTELITFLANYKEHPLSLLQKKQTNIVIANQKYNLGFPEVVDQIIGSYTGFSSFLNFNDGKI